MKQSTMQADRLVSAKRTKNERSGVHSWHPYYAGYAEMFVETAIDYLKLTERDIVLDPWNGSGTTSLVCGRRDINTIGFDVNEAMNIFSMAKSSFCLYSKDSIIQAGKDISSELMNCQSMIDDKDPLLQFMSKSLCSGVRYLFSEIENYKFKNTELTPLFRNTFRSLRLQRTPEHCFLLSALFTTARKLAGYKGGSNPTWIKTIDNKPPVKKSTLRNEFVKSLETMMDDLVSTSIQSKQTLNNIALLGNSRNLSICNNSIDAVITSPPYLTRIDYAMSTRPELLILSDENSLRTTREATMGAPVIVDKNILANKVWGNYCNSILKNVEGHSSKAAKSYYHTNMLQYFRDAEESIREILRVLKSGSKALIVVQSSYFKELEIDLSKIYLEIAINLGADANIAFKEIVRGHMAHVNKKSNEYKSNKIFFESVVEITKR